MSSEMRGGGHRRATLDEMFEPGRPASTVNAAASTSDVSALPSGRFANFDDYLEAQRRLKRQRHSFVVHQSQGSGLGPAFGEGSGVPARQGSGFSVPTVESAVRPGAAEARPGLRRGRFSTALQALGGGMEEFGEAEGDLDDDHEQQPLPFYEPPVQRQRWGEDQVLPHVDWGDLFFDLFYVGLATNAGAMLVSALKNPEVDLLRGIIYFIGCFGPLWLSWETSMQRTSSFTTIDYVHRLIEVVRYLLVSTAIVNIKTIDSLYHPERAGALIFCIAISLEALVSLALDVELYQKGKGDRGAITHQTARVIAYKVLPTTAIYLAATAVAAVLHVRALAPDAPDNLVDDIFDDPRPMWDMHDLPFTLLVFAHLQQLVFTNIRVWRATSGKYGDIRDQFVPHNIEYNIQRYGDWSLLMIGEGVVSLLIVSTVAQPMYYITTIFGTLTMMFIQVLKFESEPHRAEEHALWKGFANSVIFSYLMQILSLGLIAFGPTYKIYLMNIIADRCPRVAEGAVATSGEGCLAEQTVPAALFCWSLAAILLSLQLMKWSHSGLTKAWSDLTKLGADNAKLLDWPLIITGILRMILLVCTVMLQYWTQEPYVLTLCGFVVVFAYTATRVFILYLVHRKHVVSELTENFTETIKTIAC